MQKLSYELIHWLINTTCFYKDVPQDPEYSLLLVPLVPMLSHPDHHNSEVLRITRALRITLLVGIRLVTEKRRIFNRQVQWNLCYGVGFS